jgi:hypothetical protein
MNVRNEDTLRRAVETTHPRLLESGDALVRELLAAGLDPRLGRVLLRGVCAPLAPQHLLFRRLVILVPLVAPVHQLRGGYRQRAAAGDTGARRLGRHGLGRHGGTEAGARRLGGTRREHGRGEGGGESCCHFGVCLPPAGRIATR